MRQGSDIGLLKLLEEELVENFVDEREQMRRDAKENIMKCQEEQRRVYNRKCKSARRYQVNDLVSISRTQFGVGLKLSGKFLGPYKVIRCLPNERYEVRRVGDHEGPLVTTSSADHMKQWNSDDSSEADK